MDIQRLDLDLHRLELRFAASRLVEPRAVARIAHSIEQSGQVVPCIVVGDPGAGHLVLVDGYRRVAALRRLGHDTACVERWDCALSEALLGVLARAEGRSFAALEEALLMRELIDGEGLSQHEVARRCGRDVSWVCRRLQLLSALPDAALAAVREGWLSSWAATRILMPLARANAAHTERLLCALRSAPLSTRDLGRWFEAYGKASRAARERMVDQPGLLLKALGEQDERRGGAKLRGGPEGECATDVRIIEAVMARLRKRLATLHPLPTFLGMAAIRLRSAMNALTNEMERYGDDPDRDPQCGPNAACARQGPARDQQAAGAVA